MVWVNFILITGNYIVFFFPNELLLTSIFLPAARNHVNRMCLAADVPLIESGTAGYLGQVTTIKKVKNIFLFVFASHIFIWDPKEWRSKRWLCITWVCQPPECKDFFCAPLKLRMLGRYEREYRQRSYVLKSLHVLKM